MPVPIGACSAVQNPGGELLVVSDLPLRGSGRAQALQMKKAIVFMLAQEGWKAGAHTLAYQSCDDSTARAAAWSPTACSTNATAYGADASVIGVIGPLNSGCAQIEVPIANRAARGPLAMVSPSNTYVGLTHSGPGAEVGDPGRYYPTGKRNYARVIAPDDVQAVAAAMLASRLHVRKLFVLSDGESYGEGMAASAAAEAKKRGITIVRSTTWNAKSTSYTALARQIKASGAQALYLGGYVDESSGRLIKDVHALAPDVAILAPAGFTPVSADVQQSGGAANGMYVTVPGLPVDRLPPRGKAFVRAFGKRLGGAAVDPYAVYAAEAAEVMVKAIAGSDATRAGVAARLYKLKFKTGLLGLIDFDANGDLGGSPVTVYRIVGNRASEFAVIRPQG